LSARCRWRQAGIRRRDGKGGIYVNIEDTSELVHFDAKD